MRLYRSQMMRRIARRWIAREFPSQESLEAYLDEHPNASKDKHWVRNKGEPKEFDSQEELEDYLDKNPDASGVEHKVKGEKPKADEEPEDKAVAEEAAAAEEADEGPDSDPAGPEVDPADHKPTKAQVDFVGKGEDTAVQRVVTNLSKGKKPTPSDIPKGLLLITKALADRDLSQDDIDQLRSLEDLFESMTGAEKPEASRSKRVRVPENDVPEEAIDLGEKHSLKPGALRKVKQHAEDFAKLEAKKRRSPEANKAREEYGLEDHHLDDIHQMVEDAKEEAKLAEKDPPSFDALLDLYLEENPDQAETMEGISSEEFETLAAPPKKPKPISELKADFVKNSDDPDAGERVKGMSNAEFKAMLEALGVERDSGGGGRFRPRSRSRRRKRSALRETAIRLASTLGVETRRPLLALLRED